jgi:DNA-binding winged helix-turn-helix (wHTH) protein
MVYNRPVASRKDARSATSDFHVGRWIVQPALNLICSGATTQHLEPQVMDLLVFLAHSGGSVVSKDEIIDVVWEGRFIAESTLTRSMADLRRALGDRQQRPQYIETIAKRGYRLVAPVSSHGRRPVPSAAEAAPVDARGETGPIVLPFNRAARNTDLERERASPGGLRVADRLASARQRRFVGRERELELFRAALQAAEPPFVALHVLGAGGVGKTTLLQEFARVARDAGRAAVRIDGRNIEPSATGFLVALRQALGVEGLDLPSMIEHWPAGGVLLVDTYERLAPLDDWLRLTLLPQLPSRSIVVVAGRHDPGTAWRTDVDWAALTHIHSLGNLGRDDSRRYLATCGVSAQHHDEALAFTRGHPLALSLVVDVLTRGNRVAASLETEPDVVRLLLEKFVQEAPSRDHRLALHACVTVWATTEPLLAAALDRPDAHDLFEWLGQLSFIEHGPHGLFPHDLARDVVYADFRWRDPDAVRRITERIVGYLYDRLERTSGFERQRVWFDALYVQRYNAAIRPYLDWAGFGTAYAETARAADHHVMLAMVERHEGAQSAAIARHWIERQPEAFIAVRGVDGDLMGFLANLHLERATPEDLALDPAAALAVAHIERHGPAQAGEQVLYGRFWMDAERHQELTQVLTIVAATTSQSWTARNVAWCFVAMAHPDLMAPLFTEIHIWRTREADFEIGGRRYGVFAHDWRVETAAQWLSLKVERALRIDGAMGG